MVAAEAMGAVDLAAALVGAADPVAGFDPIKDLFFWEVSVCRHKGLRSFINLN